MMVLLHLVNESVPEEYSASMFNLEISSFLINKVRHPPSGNSKGDFSATKFF